VRTWNPQFAVAIPHPDRERTAFAIDSRTLTLPARAEAEGFKPQSTYERTALGLAQTVTGSRLHSVDRRLVSEVQQTLYIMKPSEDDVLQAGHEWLDCDIETIRGQYREIKDLPLGRKRESQEKIAMQALHIFTLFNAMGTDREKAVLLSWFCENSGMYGLDKLV